jgi:hypothetical protein
MHTQAVYLGMDSSFTPLFRTMFRRSQIEMLVNPAARANLQVRGYGTEKTMNKTIGDILCLSKTSKRLRGRELYFL